MLCPNPETTLSDSTQPSGLTYSDTDFDVKEKEIRESGPKVTWLFKVSGKFDRWRDIPKIVCKQIRERIKI